ncbi:hypothetical protein PUN4_830080 [Paraburkholderia unamae]|nr:hypothetical protein PUN4_830080 [Paraburkholderia unamae]
MRRRRACIAPTPLKGPNNWLHLVAAAGSSRGIRQTFVDMQDQKSSNDKTKESLNDPLYPRSTPCRRRRARLDPRRVRGQPAGVAPRCAAPAGPEPA